MPCEMACSGVFSFVWSFESGTSCFDCGAEIVGGETAEGAIAGESSKPSCCK
jgi:hypothetical protein